MATNVSDPAAREYANALFLVASEKGVVGTVFQDFSAVYHSYKHDKAFYTFFTSPKIPGETKRKLIDATFGPHIHQVTRNFLYLLVRKHRELLLDNVFDAFAKHRDVAENRVHAFVETASPADEALKARIKASIEAATGKKAEMHFEVAPHLIGGMRIKVGDKLLDNSLHRRLMALAGNLLNQDVLSAATLGGADDTEELFKRAAGAVRTSN